MADITVVIPTKDRPHLLPRAVASVLEQADDAEVFVIDDGSSPDNAEKIAAFCATDVRLRHLRNAVALGAPHGRNQGLAEASGRWWATLDDDDVWLPGKWAAQREILERHGDDVVAVMGIQDNGGRPVRTDLLPAVREPERLSRLGELLRRVPPASFLNTYVVPTALMREIGGYDERLVWGEHTDVLIRLSAHARFAAADGIGVEVDRGHAEGGGRVGRDWVRKIEGIRLLLDKHAEAFAHDAGVRSQYLHVLGVSQLRAGDRWGASRTFLRVAGAGPSTSRRVRALGHFVLSAIGGRSLLRRTAGRATARAEIG